ncbi:MAG: hypothetical protein ACP5NV_04520 [Candidatus Woesearchaeota archaeon]
MPNIPSKITLEENLKEAWDDTKKLFGYPALEDPVFENAVGTAAINMENHAIYVNKNFVKNIRNIASKNGRNTSDKEILEGLLQHEVNHYMYCPYDLATAMKIENEISKISGANSHIVANYFMDVVINLDLLTRKKRKEILNIYQNIPLNHPVDELMCALYQIYSKTDIGIKISDPVLVKKLSELKRIPYQKKDKWTSSARKFALIINDLITEENKSLLNTVDSWDANSYSDSEIDKALSDIAKEMTPEDFMNTVFGSGIAAGIGASMGSGNNFGMPLRADSFYYEQQSKKYLLKISPSPSKSRSAEYSEHKKWEVSESFGNVDVFNSYGKYLPGISNVWRESSYTESGSLLAIPDLVIAIDTSCSMPNPLEEFSNAVLGSFCATNIYLENKSSVATYNFSSNIKTTAFCMDKKIIYDNLVYFQGEGTIFDISEFAKIVSETKKKTDIIIVSDFYIMNINELLEYLESSSKINRTNLLIIEPGNDIIPSKKIFTYKITNPSDIPKIMVGESRRYNK